MNEKLRKLSEIKRENKYAYCSNCDEYFIDDIITIGVLSCPNNCGLVLERNIDEIRIDL